MSAAVYQIDRKKEYKTLVIASIIFFFMFGILAWLAFLARGIFGKEETISVGVFIIAFLIVWISVLLILVSNSKKDIHSWRLEVLNDETFIVTTSRQKPTSYHQSQISKIDARDERMLFLYLKENRKRIYINSNLEQYDIIVAYFRAMAQQIKISSTGSVDSFKVSTPQTASKPAPTTTR